MDEFMFNFIFSELKDRTFCSAGQFRGLLEKKYGIKDRQFGTRLWTAISNYQIKKYGQSINPQIWIDFSKEELRRKGNIARTMKYKKRRK